MLLKRILVCLGVLGISLFSKEICAQENKTVDIGKSDVEKEVLQNDTLKHEEGKMVNGVWLNEKQLQRYNKKLHKDSIRAKKPVWWSILGGPSYTPEASLGIGGAVLASFRMNKNDSISQRSFIPAGFNVTLN